MQDLPVFQPLPTDALAGLVLRPPGARWDGRRYCGPSLAALDTETLEHMPGFIRLVAQGSFVGLAGSTPTLVLQAAARLQAQWQAAPDSAAMGGGHTLSHEYRWTGQAPGASGEHQVVVWAHAAGASVWTPHAPGPRLRRELAALLGCPETAVQVHRLPSSGALPDPLALIDAAADAALLSRACATPVRIAVGKPQDQALPALKLSADLDERGHIADLYGPMLLERPSLARLLAGGASGSDQDAPGYALALLPAADAAQALPGAPLGQSLPAWVFAQESFIDEAAHATGADPIEYRLEHIDDPRARALIEDVSQRAGWTPRISDTPDGAGRGFAYASVLDATQDPPRQVWAAWVADVKVDPRTGLIDVTRLVVGHDSEAGRTELDAAALDRELLAATRQLLQAPAPRFDDWATPLADDGTAGPESTPESTSLTLRPLIQHALAEGSRQLAAPGQGLAWTPALALPAAAAIANAVFDATGVRLRETPFDGAAVRRQLGAPAAPEPRKRPLARAAAWLGATAAGVAGATAMLWPWPAAIAPIVQPDIPLYSAAAIERGRLVAQAGDCAVCHTAPSGRENAGGLALDTPFGTIYTSNITPDPQHGIGNWSYTAFERAMREGIHRDGRRLYPAFPYTAYAKLSDADMQALYAYLMTRPAVAEPAPATKLAFPYNARPLLAGWNMLFHDDSPFQPDPTQSTQWNRGAYLVLGAGHCGACHTPRNALGAEKNGNDFLSGGLAEGWQAPALNTLNQAGVPWTEQDLTAYLRTGYSPLHGVAAGPMAPVIHGLAQLPEQDVKAMAVYLLSLNQGAQPAAHEAAPQPAPSPAAQALALESRSAPQLRLFDGYAKGERLYENACAVCHEAGQGPTLHGVKPSLALNTNLQAGQPDNLIQVILNGITQPADPALGYMPGFRDSFDDQQINDLVAYLRVRFGNGQPAWTGLQESVARIRAQPVAH
ncbi:MAG TPA: c-type cytochrome [Bordetella sp.]